MAHFIQYHNPTIMGEFRSSDTFGIVSNKGSGLREGDIVWLVTGEGKPHQYFLCETFVVEKIRSQSSGQFNYRMTGTDGRALVSYELASANEISLIGSWKALSGCCIDPLKRRLFPFGRTARVFAWHGSQALCYQNSQIHELGGKLPA